MLSNLEAVSPHAIKSCEWRDHDGGRAVQYNALSMNAHHGALDNMKWSEQLRSVLLAEPALTKYVDALCEHAEALIAGTDDREAMHAQLRSCGVRVIGHRHRAAAVMGKLKTELHTRSADAVVPSASSVAPASAMSMSGLTTLGLMISRCEKHTGPLPFVVTPSLRKKLNDNSGMHLHIHEDYPGLCKISVTPPIYLCEHFATDAECDALVRCADPLLLRSMTDSGVSQVRTSRSTHLCKETPPCPSLLAKVQALTRKPISHMEVPQVARYECGQFYRMHYDSTDAESSGRMSDEPGGPRACTVLIYCNDVAVGGGTRFNMLGLQLQPRKGTALVFFPTFTDGTIDTDTLHEALPADETKFVCQIWVRQHELPHWPDERNSMGHRLLAALQPPPPAP
jgi:prolyl 4-hydroxylase